MSVFMERLQQLMNEQNLNDTELREMLGLSKNSLTNWRKGMKPQASTVHRLADFFGVSYDWLLGIDGYKRQIRAIIEPKQTPPDALIQELMEMYKQCSAQSQIYINKVIWEEWKRNHHESD